MRHVDPEPNITDRQIEADVRREIEALPELGQNRKDVSCRVCMDEATRTMVNRMLANMMPYSEILKAVDLSINPLRAKNKKVSYKSVYRHAKTHFNIQEPAKGVYRDMMEKRAAEYAEQQREIGIDGVAKLVNAFGFLDVVAHKGYETLVDENTRVPVQQGMDAVIKLHEMTKLTTREQENAELKQQLALIQNAVKEVVPQEYWAEIIARIEDAEGRHRSGVVDAEVIDDEYADDDPELEPYSPFIETDEDDELEP